MVTAKQRGNQNKHKQRRSSSQRPKACAVAAAVRLCSHLHQTLVAVCDEHVPGAVLVRCALRRQHVRHRLMDTADAEEAVDAQFSVMIVPINVWTENAQLSTRRDLDTSRRGEVFLLPGSRKWADCGHAYRHCVRGIVFVLRVPRPEHP